MFSRRLFKLIFTPINRRFYKFSTVGKRILTYVSGRSATETYVVRLLFTHNRPDSVLVKKIVSLLSISLRFKKKRSFGLLVGEKNKSYVVQKISSPTRRRARRTSGFEVSTKAGKNEQSG